MTGSLSDALQLGQGGYRTQAEKVAILLASLDNTIAIDLLKRFAPADVRQIVESSGHLGSLNSGDVEPLIDEFTTEFVEALGISAGSTEIISLLEAAFPAKELAAIMGKDQPEEGESVWVRFKTGLEATLVPYLLDESEQTTAVVLSRLPPELSARCIALLPRGISKNVVSRMLSLNDVAPVAIRALEATLAEDFFTVSASKDKSARIDKMAAVVNKLDRQQSSDLLEDLAKTNPEEMKTLRKMIFMFEDIEKLEHKFRTRLFDRVPTELVIPALFGAEAGLKEGILSSLGARARRMVESELQGDASQPRKDTIPARRKIADLAVQMIRSGDIDIPESGEENKAATAQ